MAGTPVQTIVKGGDGKYRVVVKPIEKMHKGDLVLARDQKTGRTQVRRVPRTVVRHTNLVLTVSLADTTTHKVVEKVTASRQHPFYVRGKGFVPAGGLAVGNAIVTRAGPALEVRSIQWNRSAEGYTVYNFVVEDDHSYFVGTHNGGAWVHNPDGDCAELAKLSVDELKALVYDQPDNINHLRDFFGRVTQSGPQLPNIAAGQNLARGNLEAYRELAQRIVDAGKDSTGVQASLIQQINDFLKGLP